MGERTDQIERQIAETRRELSDNVGELQDKVKSAMDWRKQFEEHPGTLLAVAFGGGVVLSAILPSHRAKQNPAAHDSTDEPIPSNAPTTKSNDLHRSIDAFTGALLGVAVNKASGFLDSLLPGFHQEFTKAKDKNSRNDNAIDVTTNAPKPLAAKASA